jgi:phage host-nuclease inhibitor protein Gam
MSKARIKKTLTNVVQTREEAEARMNDLAVAANHRISLIADMDAEILAIKDEYEAWIAKQDADIKQAAADLEAWALANPDQFEKPKSLAFLSGTLGFRTGTPKLALLNRKWNWETVTSAVERMLPNFIRTKPEVDKDAILGQRDELAEFLPQVGLKVTQDEGFFIEPKLTKKAVTL